MGKHLSSAPATQKIGVIHNNTMQGRSRWILSFFGGSELDFFTREVIQIKIRDTNKSGKKTYKYSTVAAHN